MLEFKVLVLALVLMMREWSGPHAQIDAQGLIQIIGGLRNYRIGRQDRPFHEPHHWGQLEADAFEFEASSRPVGSIVCRSLVPK